jgi:MmeI, DNA-methyltransferase domain/MmeI, N-terminal domain/MmeI, target recognition domain/MmeI, helicase spacer domain
MALSDEEIRQRLTRFAADWGGYQGTERSEAQTFCNELLACYGTDRKSVATFEERTSAGGFIDMIWSEVCLIEMKRPSEANKLAEHREQALNYWKEVSKQAGESGHKAPEWIVLCAFERFEVLDPDAGWDKPVDRFPLAELPERLASLKFLTRKDPYFRASQADLSRAAVGKLTNLYAALRDRRASDLDTLRIFILQIVWTMFAEDLGLLPNNVLSRALEGLIKDPGRSSADDLGQLFRYLSESSPRPPKGSLYEGTPYANGGLFEHPAQVHLMPDELTTLRDTCNLDWHQVEPAIFGAILQGALGKDKQWALGAHYTSEADIMKIVGPTVVDPWSDRIEAVSTVAEAEHAWRDLMSYVVLDPACGSGNFLYVAYRELRKLELRLRERLAELRVAEGIAAQEEMEFFPISNMRGIEVEVFAAELARVTLWMGHKLAADEMRKHGLSEPTLPLVDLSGIQRAHALRVEWPEADAIIGNPPYHGSNTIRRELGDEEVEFLKKEFGIGVKDYAVYWFRKAHERLQPGGRAGLVATNSVTQNRNRKPSLEWIVDNGGIITNAISKEEWTGDATVNVSIIDWTKEPAPSPSRLILDGVEVDAISTSLRPVAVDVNTAARLPPNQGFAFQGPIPVGDGFILSESEARALLARTDVNYHAVVRPYLTSQDIAEDPRQEPRRWVIDFATMPLDRAENWAAAVEILRERVKPMRDRNNDRGFRERWWLFGRPRGKMRQAISALPRYIAGTRHGVRLHFCWCEPATMASDATNVFSFDDDFSMGVLCSAAHVGWAWIQSSTIREDIRYTPQSVFATFPWPRPTAEQAEEIANVCGRLHEMRGELCVARGVGLTALYNEVDDGMHRELKKLHHELDRAVVSAYGWPASVAGDTDESNRRLLELNHAIAAGKIAYGGPAPRP